MDMDLWSLGLRVHADATYPVLETYANISMNNICLCNFGTFDDVFDVFCVILF